MELLQTPADPGGGHKSDVEKYEGEYRIGWDELRRRRPARMIELGIMDKRWPLTPRDADAPAWETVQDKAARNRAMAVYAAQIDRMDQNIGRVLSKLEELRAMENTLVLFLSDNGGCAERVNRGKDGVPPGGPESYSSYGLPWTNASNTPFRLYKHWVHEGGIATPMIAHWPAGIRQPGRLHPQVGHVADFMATFVDVGRAKYPRRRNGQPITPMQGRSLARAFADRPAESRRVFWEHEGNRAMRDGKWKLVSRHPDSWELYDLEADRTEINDLHRQAGVDGLDDTQL
jgi:arylsulfatase